MIRSSSVGAKEVKEMLAKLHSGELELLKTGVDWLDESSLGGLAPSSIIGIAALSGHGKTTELMEIQENLRNNYKDLVFVDLLWEMTEWKLHVKLLAKETGQSVRDIYSQKPTPEMQAKYDKILERFNDPNLYVQPHPADADTFFEDIKSIIEKHPDQKIIVSIDNLENTLLKGTSQKNSMDLVLQRINVLTKMHKYIVFIILNQLNSEFEDNMSIPEKMFPTARSVYGTRAMEKLCDVLAIKVLPYRFGLEKYGVFSKNRYKYIPDEYKYRMDSTNKTTSFLCGGKAYIHIVKSRGLEEEYDAKNLYVKHIFDVPEQEVKKSRFNVEDIDY